MCMYKYKKEYCVLAEDYLFYEIVSQKLECFNRDIMGDLSRVWPDRIDHYNHFTCLINPIVLTNYIRTLNQLLILSAKAPMRELLSMEGRMSIVLL